MVALLTLLIVACIPMLLLLAATLLFRLIRYLWRGAGPGTFIQRVAIVAVGLGLVLWPYLAFKAWERRVVLARVPGPLDIAAIEYRLEESWGIGLPGDNETGFVIYRLTDDSTRWARSKGKQLREYLPGGSDVWRPTPVDEGGMIDRWHKSREAMATPHRATIAEYLDRYGFSIPLETGRDAEADHAIQNAGSVYSFGRGGSVTIIDPIQGKVYFAYAG